MSSEHLLRAHLAPEPRTLVDIVRATAAAYPEAAAIDDGEVLTYSELLEEVEAKAAELHALGIGRGSRVGIRMTSGSKDLYVAILALYLIHICRCRRLLTCRSRWSPYH